MRNELLRSHHSHFRSAVLGGGDGWIEKESEISGLYTSMSCYTSLLTFL